MDDISLKAVKRGMIYWESEGGQDAAFIAVADARKVKGGLEVEGRELATGKTQRHFEGDGAGGYGPRLYTLPQYSRPDWPALLSGLAAVALVWVDEIARVTANHTAIAEAKARQATDALNAEAAKASRLVNEVAALREKLVRIEAICARPANGIELSNRIRLVIEERQY